MAPKWSSFLPSIFHFCCCLSLGKAAPEPSCPIQRHLPLPRAFFFFFCPPFISSPLQLGCRPQRMRPEEQPRGRRRRRLCRVAEPTSAAAAGARAGALTRDMPTRSAGAGQRVPPRAGHGPGVTHRRDRPLLVPVPRACVPSASRSRLGQAVYIYRCSCLNAGK